MITKIKKEDLENLIENGITFKEIAKKYEVSLSSIRRLCYKYKLKSKFNELKSKKINCLNCQIEVKTTIKEDKKFCSHSCSAIFNNKKRKVSNKCLNCNIDISKRQKYCSIKCQHIFVMYKKISENKASSKTIRRYLIENYGYKCMECGWCEINKVTGKVPIELEHIDGDSENNSLENVKLLCPNCHSLTPTYKALNIGNGRHKRMERYKEGKSY
jgi:predicted nucleic acid-binding Zn ribbon protein